MGSACPIVWLAPRVHLALVAQLLLTVQVRLGSIVGSLKRFASLQQLTLAHFFRRSCLVLRPIIISGPPKCLSLKAIHFLVCLQKTSIISSWSNASYYFDKIIIFEDFSLYFLHYKFVGNTTKRGAYTCCIFIADFFNVFPTSSWSVHILYFLHDYFGKIIISFLSHNLHKKSCSLRAYTMQN